MRDSFSAYRAALAARFHRAAFASYERRAAFACVVLRSGQRLRRCRRILRAQGLEHFARAEGDFAEAERVAQVDGFLAEAKFAPLAQENSTVLASEVADDHPILADDHDLGMDAAH